MNKRIAVFMILILIFALTACGGGGQSSNVESSSGNTATTEQPSTNEQQPAASEPATEEVFADFQGNQPAKFSGSKNNEFKLSMQEGGYLIIMKTKDNLNGLSSVEAVSSSGMGIPLFSGAAAGKDDSGWYSYERVEHWYSTDDTTFKIETAGSYLVEIYKLPIESEKSIPLNVKSAGAKVIGPFAADGAINVKMKSQDAKQAGFTVTLVNGQTGEPAESVYLNMDLQASKMINEFDLTQNVAIAEAGSYFLFVNANAGCEWEVEVSK